MNRAEQLRTDRGLNLRDVCEATGLAYATVRNIEEGTGARADKLKVLGDFYKVPASSLLLPAREPEGRAA